MTGAGIALDILEDHQPDRKALSVQPDSVVTRYAWVLGIRGRVELENQVVEVVMI